MGGKCCITLKIMDDEIISDIYRIIKVEVDMEWLIVGENAVQCTPCKLVGFVCNHEVSSYGKCVC